MILSIFWEGQGLFGLSYWVTVTVIGAVAFSGLSGMGRVIWREMSWSHMDGGAVANRPRRKCDIDGEEWFAILGDAKREFYIAGHTMGKWCDESCRDRFTGELRRIVAAGGQITLVMLAPDSQQLPVLLEATGKDYKGRINQSVPVLRELEESLSPEHRRRLRIKRLDDKSPIPYMVVGNERKLVMATYLARTDSDDVPCVQLELPDKPAQAIYDDFHKLAGVSQSRGAGGANP